MLIGLGTVSVEEPPTELVDQLAGPPPRSRVGNISDRVWGRFGDPYQGDPIAEGDGPEGLIVGPMFDAVVDQALDSLSERHPQSHLTRRH